jgi:hypothetical protein
MLWTLPLTYIEPIDPGDYQRTISTLDIYSPKERFLLALQGDPASARSQEAENSRIGNRQPIGRTKEEILGARISPLRGMKRRNGNRSHGVHGGHGAAGFFALGAEVKQNWRRERRGARIGAE